ncbi:4Fe-4S cluster-binding domain-containing protein [Clostridium beijerinckii]|uniref:radical SAM protein n=1 Tax=Clostridium beijerinckii TaxID=1520 RepID=UPI0022261FEA|nr:radical SAM protein [Clostridium beijerinckii]UYZ34251.1 4Fe-4S cluster-binding domain-containing protein [Clostridium beijerinckii]
MKWTNKGNEFDEIGNKFKGIEKIYIYGAGKLGSELFNILKFFDCFDCEIKFVDIDKEKQKSGFAGKKVLSPEELFQESKENKIVVVAASQINTKTIMNNLSVSGYKCGFDCFVMQEFMEYYLPIYSVYAKNKVFFPSISFLPTTRCNLNCAACLNFNPYNKNKIDQDLNILKTDIDKFFECVDYINLFHISGGEPMLYSNMGELIEYIYNNYGEKIYNLTVTTNGTILPSSDLCKTIVKHNVSVILDDYSESVPKSENKLKAIIERFDEIGVCYSINKVDFWVDLCPTTTNHSDWSEGELINHYDSCKNPFQELRDQKLYSCNYASYAMKAGLNYDSCNDYYDMTLFGDDKKKELVEFRLGYTEKGYVNFCKKCSALSTKINRNIVEVAKQI